jgi:hypothetical protein
MIYVSLIYVSMKKQASKQAKKSICGWGDPRSGQAQYRTFVPPLGGARPPRDTRIYVIDYLWNELYESISIK